MRTRNANFVWKAILIVVLCFGCESRLAAQATSGNLVGSVTDPSGALVPGATVEVTNTATNVKNTTRTDADGHYQIENLPAGTYDIRVQHAGFNEATLRNVAIRLNVTSTQNVQLAIGDVATVV